MKNTLINNQAIKIIAHAFGELNSQVVFVDIHQMIVFRCERKVLNNDKG
jgi:hypothetical protein